MDFANSSLDRSSANCSTAADPAYVVGRDRDGHWLTVEPHGLGIGDFAPRYATIHDACGKTGRQAGAVLLVEAPISLAAAPIARGA